MCILKNKTGHVRESIIFITRKILNSSIKCHFLTFSRDYEKNKELSSFSSIIFLLNDLKNYLNKVNNTLLYFG